MPLPRGGVRKDLEEMLEDIEWIHDILDELEDVIVDVWEEMKVTDYDILKKTLKDVKKKLSGVELIIKGYRFWYGYK